jgi:4'-phosphopantetheinyl transferase
MSVRIDRVRRDVWVAHAELADLAGLATNPGDRRRAAPMGAPRRREFLSGRRLLRLLLGVVAEPARDGPVASDPCGRPVLPDWPDLQVSVSHDGGYVAAAVAQHRIVGVDVQRPDPQVHDRTLHRCLGEHLTDLSTADDNTRAAELAWVWTAQEACVKATGAGLSGRPWTIDVPPFQTDGRWRQLRWISLRDTAPAPLSCAFGPSAAEAPRGLYSQIQPAQPVQPVHRRRDEP